VSEPNRVDKYNVLLVENMATQGKVLRRAFARVVYDQSLCQIIYKGRKRENHKVAIIASKLGLVFWRMYSLRLLITAWSYYLPTAAGVGNGCPHSQHSLHHNASGSDTSGVDFVVNKLIWWDERHGRKVSRYGLVTQSSAGLLEGADVPTCLPQLLCLRSSTVGDSSNAQLDVSFAAQK
jgi:hypothetical protein